METGAAELKTPQAARVAAFRPSAVESVRTGIRWGARMAGPSGWRPEGRPPNTRPQLRGSRAALGVPLLGLRLPVGPELSARLWARTGACLEGWASCGASPTVLAWLRDGYRLPWRAAPPPPFDLGVSCDALDAQARAWLLTELQRGLLTGAHEPATTCADYITRMFIIPKAGVPGKWRMIIDLRHVNSFLLELVCKYETLASVRGMFARDDYCISLDLQDGYMAVPVHPAHRKYLTFDVAGVGLFQCASLPLGLSASPFVFVKTMRPFVAAMRSPMEVLRRAEAARGSGYVPPARRLPGQSLRSLVVNHSEVMALGMAVLPYMDDFAAALRTYRLAVLATAYIDDLLVLLGLQRAMHKGCWVPTQRLEHLGLGVDTRLMVFFVPEKRRLKLAAAAGAMLALANANRNLVPRRRLAGTAGLVASTWLALPLARFHLRALFDVMGTEERWDAKVRLTDEARRSLAWLCRIPEKHLSRPIEVIAATAEVWTDASLYGWGGAADVNDHHLTAQGVWSQAEALLHINVLEMRAKTRVTEALAEALANRHVHFLGDNTVVTFSTTSGTSRSPELMRELRVHFACLDMLNISATQEWLSSAANWEADALSRPEGGPQAICLRYPVVRTLLLRFGPHSVDRFASSDNAVLSLFNTERAEPRSAGVDAFAQTDWLSGRSWCHPPVGLLSRLVDHLRQTGAEATVVAPDWPAQQWHQQLRALASSWEALPARRRPYASPAAELWGCVIFRVPRRL